MSMFSPFSQILYSSTSSIWIGLILQDPGTYIQRIRKLVYLRRVKSENMQQIHSYEYEHASENFFRILVRARSSVLFWTLLLRDYHQCFNTQWKFETFQEYFGTCLKNRDIPRLVSVNAESKDSLIRKIWNWIWIFPRVISDEEFCKTIHQVRNFEI